MKITLKNIDFIMDSSGVKEIENLHPNKSIKNYGEMSGRSIKLKIK